MKKQKQEMPLGEWLYLNKEGSCVRELAEALSKNYEVELWEDAGVLEIMFAEGKSMDIEHAKIHPKDEVTRAFVEKMGYEEVFLVTFAPEAYEAANKLMQEMIAACGGLFCGDTEDFLPIVRGN